MKDPHRQVSELREQIGTLRAERERVADARVPLEEAEQAAQRYVAELAESWDPNLGPLTYGRGRPSLILPVLSHVGGQLYSGDADQVEALLAAAVPQAMTEAIAGRLRRFYDSDGVLALSAADRDRRLTEIDAQLRRLEEREERAILAAEAQGLTIDRRADASPEAVLEVDWTEETPGPPEPEPRPRRRPRRQTRVSEYVSGEERQRPGPTRIA